MATVPDIVDTCWSEAFASFVGQKKLDFTKSKGLGNLKIMVKSRGVMLQMKKIQNISASLHAPYMELANIVDLSLKRIKRAHYSIEPV